MRLAWLVVIAACGGSGAEPAPAKPVAPVEQTPCFPGRPPLDAAKVYRDLEKHALAFGAVDPPVPAETYGTCTVADGRIRTADGVEIAQLHCGIEVKVPGFLDHLGLQVGAKTDDVIAGHPRAQERILCADEGPGRTRCWFQEVDDLRELTHYVVDGGIHSDEVWRGAQALAFFRGKRVVSMTIRMWCH
jgi:hypothetical protein